MLGNVFYLVMGRVIVMGHFFNYRFDVKELKQNNAQCPESHQILYLESPEAFKFTVKITGSSNNQY